MSRHHPSHVRQPAIETSRTSSRFHRLIVAAMLFAGSVRAEDEVVDLDPNASSPFQILFDLWDLLTGLPGLLGT